MDTNKTENEKGIQYVEDGGPPQREGHRGSIYQIIPPAERRMSAQGRRISVVDDVFGEIKENGPNYRNVNTTHQLRARQGANPPRLGGLELPC